MASRSVSGWFLLAVLAGAARASEREPLRAPAELFEWRESYAEAFERALERGRPLLVYFPPLGGGADPAPISGAARALGSPPAAEGVRVGARDVADLARRFGVRKVPCVLFLDRRENVLARWEGSVPADFWLGVGQVLADLRRRDSGFLRRADEALRKAEAGDLEGGYRTAAEILRSSRAPPEAVERAAEVERRLARRVRGEMLEILAAEGLREDAELRARLEKLRASTRHLGLREEIEREISRLERAKIAGA